MTVWCWFLRGRGMQRGGSLEGRLAHHFNLSYGVSSVYLITGQHGFDEFTCAKDYLPIWWEELKSIRPPIPLPPPPLVYSRTEYLRSSDVRQVVVESLRDTSIIAGLPGDYEYLISVSPELDLSDYLWIKQCLARRKEQGGFLFRLDIDVQSETLTIE